MANAPIASDAAMKSGVSLELRKVVRQSPGYAKLLLHRRALDALAGKIAIGRSVYESLATRYA